MENTLKDYSWDLGEYMPRASQAEHGKLTMQDAFKAYQLIPSPYIPAGFDPNDYIRKAQETHELKYIFFIQDEELIPDHWDYADILWSGMEAEMIGKAFRSLSYHDQTLLEQRNAICMTCGRVSDMRTQTSFETLAALFEGNGASGAERAYKRAVENLTLALVKLGALHCVRFKRISIQQEGKKIIAAVYAYQVDNGGAWGEIHFDLANRTSWVETFAENDPCDTWEITDAAIRAISDDEKTLPRNKLIPVLL